MKNIKNWHTFNEGEVYGKHHGIAVLNKYTNVLIYADDAELCIEDEESKLDIIKKYFNFKTVSGFIEYETGIVNLKIDDRFYINSGYFDGENWMVTFICQLNKDSQQPFKDAHKIEFNYHPQGGMGGINKTEFDFIIKDVFEEIEPLVSGTDMGLL